MRDYTIIIIIFRKGCLKLKNRCTTQTGWQMPTACRRSAIKIGVMYESNFLEQQTFMIHLGIRLDANLRLTPRIDERIQKARNAFFAMATQGVHTQGVNPLVSISLYKTIIKPIVLNGSELWTNITQAETYALNKFQHFVVKRVPICANQWSAYTSSSTIST